MSFRFRCFLYHLLLSAVVIAICLWLVFGVWYPAPLNKAVGVDKIILMMFAIDFVLGPVLTFIVAKEGKKSLKFDFLIIAILQLSALGYGMHNIAKGRPVYISFYYNRFELIQDIATVRGDKEKIPPEYQKNPWFGYQWVAVREAKDEDEQSDWLFKELETGISPAARPYLYESVHKNIKNILEESLPLDGLKKFNEASKVADILARYPNADGYLAMRADTQMTVLTDSKNSEIVAIVDLTPE